MAWSEWKPIGSEPSCLFSAFKNYFTDYELTGSGKCTFNDNYIMAIGEWNWDNTNSTVKLKPTISGKDLLKHKNVHFTFVSENPWTYASNPYTVYTTITLCDNNDDSVKSTITYTHNGGVWNMQLVELDLPIPESLENSKEYYLKFKFYGSYYTTAPRIEIFSIKYID